MGNIGSREEIRKKKQSRKDSKIIRKIEGGKKVDGLYIRRKNEDIFNIINERE